MARWWPSSAPSGGGKSTLLRCLTLLETFDGGSLSYGDLEVVRDDGTGSVYAGKAVQKEAKARFGLVFQQLQPVPALQRCSRTSPTRPFIVQKRARKDEVRRARPLAAGEDGAFRTRQTSVPCELSGGQQQRVAIARALCAESRRCSISTSRPARSTPSSRGEVLKVIRDLAAEHMTMVIVTHEMAFARAVADRIVFMDGGRVVEEGVAADVIARPQHERTRAFLTKYER